ncbi:calcium-dependent protein kinase 26-like [Cornus florida]|uniref:calcium-dependent protein kinase 26-like n=1 Tax=Cornus florida TaxID=4283 RepID=UPI00289EA302|nr:calcium-dependent protein kinase 26-like [Cornus florida]
MAVAKSNSSRESSSFQLCNCYKVASLAETILDSYQISNLKDRYFLGEQLGWGQFGVIRACSDKLTGEVLACKSIAKDRLVTPDDVRSIKLEIEIMTRLSGHPNVVDLKAVYEDEDSVHLVMELCAGGELFHLLEKHGRFSEAEARVLFRHLMLVLVYCHDKGVVHRDLKPENILLATKTSSSPIKLADFGLATYIKPGQSLHGTVGSPFYIAPEVLAGGYNQAADVWSAGVILYILLSGMPPFWGKTKSRIFDSVRAADLRFPSDPWDRISESAKELIRAMLCKDPSQRITAQQVLDHSWMMDLAPVSKEPYKFEQESYGELGFGGGSFSSCFCTSFMARDQDISFGTGSPIICDAQPTSNTRGSSLSSFLVEPSTPCLESGGFSFRSCGGSNTLEFSTPVSSMPSFAFFSPGSLSEQGNHQLDFSANKSGVDSVHRETSLQKMFLLPDTSLCFGHEAREMEHKAVEVKRLGGTSGYRISGIHSKRNRTIGLGEFEQLDIMVTESVIRWASCTHLPTATSLRSSLVC